MKKMKQRNVSAKPQGRHSPLMIANKDPNFDYSFRPKADIEAGGGRDMHGYEPVCKNNSCGEVWDGPKALQSKGAKGQIVFQDTICCKRPKEVSDYFKEQENIKYNSQVRLIMESGRRARASLRSLDAGSVVVDKTDFGPRRALTQRVGPTEQE